MLLPKPNLFLDLELTLIKDWYDHTLIPHNIKLIKKFILDNNIENATLFSAAVWTQKEADSFNDNLKDFLEEKLGITLDILLLTEAHKLILDKNNLSGESTAFFCDTFLFDQKENFFKEWLLASEAEGHFVLFDDTVEDSMYHRGKLTIEMRKVIP